MEYNRGISITITSTVRLRLTEHEHELYMFFLVAAEGRLISYSLKRYTTNLHQEEEKQKLLKTIYCIKIYSCRLVKIRGKIRNTTNCRKGKIQYYQWFWKEVNKTTNLHESSRRRKKIEILKNNLLY